MSKEFVHTKANTGSTYFNEYDSGSESVTTDYPMLDFVLDREIQQLLLFPKVECLIKLNGSDKEIYLPADMWTPILLRITSFSVKAMSEAGTLYWQGWNL
jgi:hypothetical protein